MNTHTHTHIKHTPPLLHCLSAVSHDLTASSRCRLLLLVFPFTPHLLTDFLSPLSLRYYTVLNLRSSFKCIFAVLVQFSQLMTSHLRLPFPLELPHFVYFLSHHLVRPSPSYNLWLLHFLIPHHLLSSLCTSTSNLNQNTCSQSFTSLPKLSWAWIIAAFWEPKHDKRFKINKLFVLW